MRHVRKLFATWSVAAGFALLFTGCASTDSSRVVPAPVHRTTPVHHSGLDPVLPPAGSGRGAYYRDDGPGAHPPPRLDLVPDAVFKPEPVAKFSNRAYRVFGATYKPLPGNAPYSQRGIASWYGNKFHGRRTASGERYDMYEMTAAHPTLPIPSYARVTNLDTGNHVIVRINDRGPFLAGRLIDVSYTAALKLGMLKKGRQHVQIDRVLASDSDRSATLRQVGDVGASTAPENVQPRMPQEWMADVVPQ